MLMDMVCKAAAGRDALGAPKELLTRRVVEEVVSLPGCAI